MSLIGEFVATLPGFAERKRTKQDRILFAFWYVQATEERDYVSTRRVREHVEAVLDEAWDSRSGMTGHINALIGKNLLEKPEETTREGVYRLTELAWRRHVTYQEPLTLFFADPTRKRPQRECEIEVPPRKTGMWWLEPLPPPPEAGTEAAFLGDPKEHEACPPVEHGRGPAATPDDESTRSLNARTFVRRDCAVFRKTAERFGGLSNMAAGFPMRVNGTRILTTEALYQACRFPHMPDLQHAIIVQAGPMGAKMKAKSFRSQSRPDWDDVKVDVMRWCLRLKLLFHWTAFGGLLRSTGTRPIVEDSHKDRFWGAVPSKADPNTLVGDNVLGGLLVEARGWANGERFRRVEPSALANLLLLGAPVGAVEV